MYMYILHDRWNVQLIVIVRENFNDTNVFSQYKLKHPFQYIAVHVLLQQFV